MDRTKTLRDTVKAGTSIQNKAKRAKYKSKGNKLTK